MRYVLAAVALTGCYQIHHPTHLRPGSSVAIAGGVAYATPKDDVDRRDGVGGDLLFAYSYAGKVSDLSAAAVQITVPATVYTYDGDPAQRISLPSLSAFLQSDLPSRRAAYGFGGILGFRPAAYAQMGFFTDPDAKQGLSIDLGLRVDTAMGVTPYTVISARIESFEVGAWVDVTRFYNDDRMFTDDPTDADYAKYRLSAGLLIR